jgi:hypothetical protein
MYITAQQYINNEGYNCTSTEYQHIQSTKRVKKYY